MFHNYLVQWELFHLEHTFQVYTTTKSKHFIVTLHIYFNILFLYCYIHIFLLAPTFLSPHEVPMAALCSLPVIHIFLPGSKQYIL